MSARMNIFNSDPIRFVLTSHKAKPNELMSVCLPANQSFTWVQQGVEYLVRGPTYKQLNSFENCYKTTMKTIQNKINAPVELRDKDIYAFSFYYDRLKSANMFKSILK
jgi:hypothetical protein